MGFDLYESRLSLYEYQTKNKRWNGEDLTNKSLFIQSEQGYGDLIQFVRFIDLLPDGNIICDVPDAVKSLFETNFPKVTFCSSFDLPECDYFLSFCSLADKTDWPKTAESLPKPPYLSASKTIPIHKPMNSKTLVGICWAGSSHHVEDYLRSIDLTIFYNSLSKSGIELYSLQYQPDNAGIFLGDYGLVHDLSPLINDFSDVAAIIDQMDCIVSVDTAVAHLAGAMNKRCYLILPYHALDWRWMHRKSDTPWYPSIKLYRQSEFETWHSVIQRISMDIS